LLVDTSFKPVSLRRPNKIYRRDIFIHYREGALFLQAFDKSSAEIE
jgi:hypothetical protein